MPQTSNDQTVNYCFHFLTFALAVVGIFQGCMANQNAANSYCHSRTQPLYSDLNTNLSQLVDHLAACALRDGSDCSEARRLAHSVLSTSKDLIALIDDRPAEDQLKKAQSQVEGTLKMLRNETDQSPASLKQEAFSIIKSLEGIGQLQRRDPRCR